MKDIVIIGIATAANLNMKKDVLFSRRDALKSAGAAIAATFMTACGTDGLQTPISSSDNNGSAKEIIPTPDLLPKVESIYPQDVDVLFKGHEEEYAQLGVSKEDVTGGYFEGSFLFHFVDKDGFDYFYLNRGSTAEPKNTFEPLDFGIDQNGNYYLGPKLSTYGILKPEPDQIKEYFVWNPNKETVSGELLITYQTDGTSDTALQYRLPDQNPIKQHLEGRAKIRQESPVPTLPPEMEELQTTLAGTDYALGWNEDQTAINLTYTDPETNEKTEIEGIAFDKAGKMTVTSDGQELDADPTTIEINGQTLTFKDKDGNIWVFDGKTLTKEAVIAEYPIEKDPYKFRNCVIELSANGDAQPMIDYVKSLKKYHGADRDYDPAKLMYNRLIDYGDVIFYDIGAPNYDDPASRPFERGAYCLTKFTTPEGKVIDYFTSFVQYYQPGLTPDKYPWLVFVSPTKFAADTAVINAYIRDMNFPVIGDSAKSQSGAFEGNDPLTEALIFSKFNDMDYRFKAATEGDMTRLDGELGIILQTRIRRGDGDFYK